MKQALVVGGTGFLGLNLVDALIAHGVRVRVTRRPRSVTVFVRKRPVELVDGSLDEPRKLRDAMRGCDAVFVTAGHYPRYSLDLEGTVEQGARGIRNACEAALEAGVPRFVYTSSLATLGPAPLHRPADERDGLRAMPTESVYRSVKWAMEREVARAADAGLPAITMLPGGCIGPGDARLGTGGIVVGAIRGALPWWVDGLVHLVDVGDVARAHLVAAERAPSGARYCLGGHAIDVEDLLRRIVHRYGGRMPSERLSLEQARARATAEEQEAAPERGRVPVPREMVDIVAAGQPVSSARAERELGFDPIPLDRSLDRAHAWFVRHRYLPAPAADSWRTHEHG